MGGDLVIGGQMGSYLIESVIGRGGMSVVYRATHSRLGTPVALKVLAPELSADDSFRERFLREAKMAATIDHANVVPIYDMGIHDGSLYIVMRFIPGGDLKSLLATQGPLDAEQAISLLMPIASALDAAHSHGLVHRDVKPGNILTQRSGGGGVERVYLSDFGIAKSSSFGSLTRAGGMIGTVEYMAPEQMTGGEVGAQTDVYALAEVFFECVTNQLPVDAESAPLRRAESISRLRPELPAALDGVIAKALAQNPSERYSTCEQFLNACSYVLQSRTSSQGADAAPDDGATVTDGAPLREDVPASAFDRWGETAAAEPPPREPPPREPPPREPPPREPPPPEPVLAGAGAASRGGAPGAADPGGRSTRAAAGGHFWNRRPLLYGLGALLVVAAVAAVLLTKSSGKSAGKSAAGAPAATLAQVPTNHVTGSGKATVALKGNVATITLTTNGLDYNEALGHALHIHGGGKGQCPPASAARDHNGHLSISTTDGINYYGSPVQALTTSGDTSTASILAFSRYPSGGVIRYKRTITLPAPVAAYIRQNNAVIVVHGTDYDHSGIYSGVLDRSELNKGVPGTATAPALCGPIVSSAKTASERSNGASREGVYTATLLTSAAAVPVGQLLLCHPPEPASEAGDVRRRSTAAAAAGAAVLG